MVAEHGYMLARMAASLTHELNSPVGTLIGSVQTVQSVMARVRRGENIPADRLASIERDLEGAMVTASRRIQEVIARVQRVANLYGAAVSRVRLDVLVADVIALLDPELRQTHPIRHEVQPGLAAECHPEQIAAVLSSLLHHLLLSDPPPEVLVRGWAGDEIARIDVAAQGLSLTADYLRCLTTPGLYAAPCTWNVYSARQILIAHGGRLEVCSTPEQGTRFELNRSANRDRAILRVY